MHINFDDNSKQLNKSIEKFKKEKNIKNKEKNKDETASLDSNYK